MDELLQAIRSKYQVTEAEAQHILDTLVDAEKKQRTKSAKKASESHGILDTIGGLVGGGDGQGVNLTSAFNDLFHRGQEIGNQLKSGGQQGGLAGVIGSLLGQIEPDKITSMVEDLLNRPKQRKRSSKKSTSGTARKKSAAKKRTASTKSKTARSEAVSEKETPARKKPAAKRKPSTAKKTTAKKTTARKKSKSE